MFMVGEEAKTQTHTKRFMVNSKIDKNKRKCYFSRFYFWCLRFALVNAVVTILISSSTDQWLDFLFTVTYDCCPPEGRS